jgi:predicted DNA-binding transcriptional regulator YafY
LDLLMLLQARDRMTAARLAQELEASVRMVCCGLDALSAARIPIDAESGPGGGCMLVEG